MLFIQFLDMRNSCQGMVPHIETVMWIVLFCLQHNRKLRQKILHKPGFLCQHKSVGSFGTKQFGQFCPDPFCTDIYQRRCNLPDGFLCFFFYMKLQLSRKPDPPQHPKSIFLKPLSGTSHTPDASALQIPQSIKLIDQAGCLIICHGIDGKIPSLQIFHQIRCKDHFLGMSVILILSIHPVRGDLIPLTPYHNRYRSMLDPGINSSAKKTLYLLRSGRCSNIPVLRFSA